ncbi:helix-turn-helix domain-containing protein [Streptomyces caniferus]|uniref:Helix-turn-helix domain-containing protein n=1 Tax=Streptomyces caniferus TaxID=285557 RepID=A0A640S918_9ACTN|nr:helix-turn-helix domain-containing protein [Streptomyces caniferus]GFE06921.1 XRE family transcriptional regulator [Streptomyces caniferus]
MVVAVNGEEFGQQLRKFRERTRLTQTELSGLSMVSVRAVRNLEQGQVAVPRRDTVRLLADALRLTSQERVAFERAAGCEAGEAMFESLTLSPTAAARPLYGREWEVDTVLRRVQSEYERITALTGFGGVGKTHLATAVAHTLRSLNGVPTLWASLRHESAQSAALFRGPLGEPAPGARVSGPSGNRVGDRGERIEALLTREDGSVDHLVRLIGDRPALLVLDGNDAGQVTRPTLWALLRECPKVRILETARTPQGGPEDYRLALRPLSVAAAAAGREETAASPAVALLVELITDLQPEFRLDEATLAVCAEVSRRLDGLPRALEAAASWFTLISPEEIVGMAREEPHLLATHPGDRTDVASTVRDAVAAQPGPYRDLLVRLSDWPGAWTVEKVVASIGIPRAQVARAIHAFLQCGLIMKVASGGDNLVRFTLLNVIRTYLQGPPGGAVPQWGT